MMLKKKKKKKIAKFLNLRIISHNEEHYPQFIVFLTDAPPVQHHDKLGISRNINHRMLFLDFFRSVMRRTNNYFTVNVTI